MGDLATRNRAYLICQQRRDSDGLTVQGDELNFVALSGPVDMHDGANVPCRQSLGGQIDG